MPDVQIEGTVKPEGGGLPIHTSQFQILVDTSEVTIAFLQRELHYSPDQMQPSIKHRLVAQISLSHMLAKDVVTQLGKALGDFEKQYPIPDIQPGVLPPPSAPDVKR